MFFAVFSQFCPIPFPQSRPVVSCCVAGYFILQAVFWYWLQDKPGLLLTTKPKMLRGNVAQPTLYLRAVMER